MLNHVAFLKNLLKLKKKKKKKKKRKENSLFCIYDPLGVKFLTYLILQFSYLNGHKFRYGFSVTINPMYACRTEVETTERFLLHCHFYSTQSLELENLEKVDPHF